MLPPALSDGSGDERASRYLWMDVRSVVARWGWVTAALIAPISQAGTTRELRPRRVSSPAEGMAPSSSSPRAAPSALLSVNKPQPRGSRAPRSACARYVWRSPEVQIARHLFAGRPCYARSRARELRGRAFPRRHGGGVLSRTGAAAASFPATGGWVCAVRAGTRCSLETFPCSCIIFF